MSKNSKKPIHEKMISQLELPKDLMLGAAIVTITGRKEVLVENYKGIIELEYYTNEEMKIVGLIDSVSYEY